jgi:ribonuclease HII
MVMAAVLLDTRAARALTRAGLRDSKSYGPPEKARQIRCELAARVRELAAFVAVRVVEVDEIDRRVARNELNLLERELAAELISGAPTCHRIVCDGRRMFGPLTAQYPHLEAWDRGESRHAAVAAASVIAKTLRDELFEAVAARYRDSFGSIAGGGYVNAATRAFLRAYASRFGCLPPEARRSWPYPYLSDLLPAGALQPAGAPQPCLPGLSAAPRVAPVDARS